MSGSVRVSSLIAGLVAATLAWAPAQAAPQRIVSVYPCLDTMLVHLADREQIAALSRYARDPRSSTIADVAATLPFTYGTAEEVIALKPDLVLTSRFEPMATRDALNRLGVATALFDVTRTVADNVAQVRAMAEVVGHPERGEALVARIEEALAAARPPEGQRPLTALVFQSNGFAAGGGVLIDELLTRTGFVNIGARYQFGQFGIISMERLVADPPQALLSGTMLEGGRSWADRMVAHPALAHLAGRSRRAAFPENLLLCGGPVIVETVALLAETRRRMEAAP